MERWELIPEEFEDGSRSGRKLITRAGKAYGHIARSCRDAREEDLMLATAAPELLKALEQFIDAHQAEYVSAMADDADRDAYDEAMDAARAAIARAKGVDRG